MKRLIGGRDTRGIIRLLQERFRPKDVAVQQAKVARAQALVFVAPVWFVGFPAILKGWIERVFTLGFAFNITPAAWRGDIGGRVLAQEHGSTRCSELTGCEFSTLSGARRFADSGCVARCEGIAAGVAGRVRSTVRALA